MSSKTLYINPELSSNTYLRNLTPHKLYEYALAEPGTYVTTTGAISSRSGEKCGRSPKDKRIVFDENTASLWWDDCSPNNKLDTKTFLSHRQTAIEHLNSLDKLFIFDGYAGWDLRHRLKVRVICERPYHCLFMYNMLIRPTESELKNFGIPDITIYNAGKCMCESCLEGESQTSIDINFTRNEIVILGTQYAGEMKKGVFTFMHYLMPLRNVLSLHSSVNISKTNENDVTIFFGLSGTGKTTLSSDEQRLLIGDDEHCWTDQGLFNIEGGCYAKCIRLDKHKEPQIWDAIKFGALLENVDVDTVTFKVDYNSNKYTENTRVSYPIHYIKNAQIPCVCNHPKNIIFLTCDAFGVLPPVSKLNHNQIIYHFISGYTAKIPGTEVGVQEPIATFSACYGEAFIVWHPLKYAELLIEKIKQRKAEANVDVNVWLVNTGWIGGSYGTTAKRCPLKITRKIIDAIHDGSLANEDMDTLPIFDLQFPKRCKNIDILNPIMNWDNKTKYFKTLKQLAKKFINNFSKYDIDREDIINSGPVL